ncbi:MAG: transcription termination factor NusA [Nitrospirota bacterium]
MNHELIQLLEQISKERGISKESLAETIESALLSAARKKYGPQNIKIHLDPKTGNMDVVSIKKVVEGITNPQTEISVEEAKKIDPDKVPEDEIEIKLNFKDLGRIAAQTAKQVILQKVKEAEREIIFNEFKKKEGQTVHGVILRQEKGAYIVDLGKTEGILPVKEQIPREGFRRGDRVRAYILEVRDSTKGPQIILSRTHPNFVARLFEMEVPEIYEGIIEIKVVVREAGDRAKIGVFSRDPEVDPVGACVGLKGSRVQSVVRELRGEKIDIIPWTDDPRVLISKALSPATIEKVGINKENKSALVVVSDQQLSLAIGKKGQNVRLAAKLTGWDIDIISTEEYEKEKAAEAEREMEAAIGKEQAKMTPLTMLSGVGDKTATLLEEAGYKTVEDVVSLSIESLKAIPGVGEKTAQKIIKGAREKLGLRDGEA